MEQKNNFRRFVIGLAGGLSACFAIVGLMASYFGWDLEGKSKKPVLETSLVKEAMEIHSNYVEFDFDASGYSQYNYTVERFANGSSYASLPSYVDSSSTKEVVFAFVDSGLVYNYQTGASHIDLLKGSNVSGLDDQYKTIPSVLNAIYGYYGGVCPSCGYVIERDSALGNDVSWKIGFFGIRPDLPYWSNGTAQKWFDECDSWNYQYGGIVFNMTGYVSAAIDSWFQGVVGDYCAYFYNFYSALYSEGYDDGVSVGYSDGYSAGDSHGFASGWDGGYYNGYNDGNFDGYSDGFSYGLAQGSGEVIDLGPTFNQVVNIPFYFMQTAFNLDVPTTAGTFNIGACVLGVFGVVLVYKIFKLVFGIFGG